MDLSIDLYDLTFEDYFKVTKGKTLTLNLKACAMGIGDASAFIELFELLSNLWGIIKFIFFFLIYIFPFFFIKKNHYLGKNFIISVITRKDEWNYGFLKSDKIKFNKVLEYSIMKKLGYKLKNRVWFRDSYSVCPNNNYEEF